MQLGHQFEQFRSTRTGRAKLPATLWQAAVEQAWQHGANVVARTRFGWTGPRSRQRRDPFGQYSEETAKMFGP